MTYRSGARGSPWRTYHFFFIYLGKFPIYANHHFAASHAIHDGLDEGDRDVHVEQGSFDAPVGNGVESLFEVQKQDKEFLVEVVGQ